VAPQEQKNVEKDQAIYINGKFYPRSEAKISVFDNGLLYGDGVFEGIRSYEGVVFRLKEHLHRLYRSAHAIMLEIPMTPEEMTKAVLETLKKNKLKDAYIRLVVTRGVGDLVIDPKKCTVSSVIIITVPMVILHSEEKKEKGITTMITWVKRDPTDATTHEVKSLNYLNSILAKIEANEAGIDEAILLDRTGFVSEGAAENIFIVRGGEIITPPTSTGALRGITRDAVLQLAERLGYTVIEKNITPNELLIADEAFLTGTAAEITPISEVNKRRIGKGETGPITKKLIQEFNKMVRDPREGVPIR
jgi:branched-chain amino acid aminotransferase